MIILEALITSAVFLIMFSIFQKRARKQIWIIDDSPEDVLLYKVKFQLDEFDVRYFSSAEMMALRILRFERPKAVIVDFALGHKVKGTQVIKFCDDNGIPSILITGYDGEITGIDKKRIIRKSYDDSFYKAVETWVHQKV